MPIMKYAQDPVELRKIAKLKENLEIRDRLLAVALGLEDFTHPEIAEKLQRSVGWSKKWISRFNENGSIEDLYDLPRPGRPTVFTPKIEKRVWDLVEHGPENSLLSRFRRKDIAQIIEEEFGISISLSAIGALLKKT